MMILVYLGAIVAANLLVARFGAAAVYVNAFLLIGLDLSCRDRLHDAWHGRHLVAKMAALILTGSAITWLLNRDAGRIAVASCVSFGLAAMADAIVYHALRRHSYLRRSNGSNVIGALVDSVVFPTIAFGGFSLIVTLGQFAAKVAGGAFWAFVLARKNEGQREVNLSR